MRTGIFCTFENPSDNYATAFSEQLELVELIERLGFDEAWIAEHHFNPRTTSPVPMMLLANLAARTSRIRLGSAAVLLPFHDPILVAEEVATMDILSGGRFDFGIAKGGPFPHQNKHFGIDPAASRVKTVEALELIEQLLTRDKVTFSGDHFKVDGLELTPKPLQMPVPTYVATSSADTVKLAAEHGYGLMAGPPWPIPHVQQCLQQYREAAGKDGALILMRFYHLAPTREQALAEARVILKPFVDRMHASTATMQPTWTAWMELERVIEDSLIGTAADVRAKMQMLEQEVGPRSLGLKPISDVAQKQREDLRVFAEMIRPQLAA